MKRVRGTVAVAGYFRINMCICVVTEIIPCLILFYTKKIQNPCIGESSKKSDATVPLSWQLSA